MRTLKLALFTMAAAALVLLVAAAQPRRTIAATAFYRGPRLLAYQAPAARARQHPLARLG